MDFTFFVNHIISLLTGGRNRRLRDLSYPLIVLFNS